MRNTLSFDLTHHHQARINGRLLGERVWPATHGNLLTAGERTHEQTFLQWESPLHGLFVAGNFTTNDKLKSGKGDSDCATHDEGQRGVEAVGRLGQQVGPKGGRRVHAWKSRQERSDLEKV